MPNVSERAESAWPSLQGLSRLVRVTFGLSAPEGRTERRHASVARAALAAGGARAVALSATLLTVPLTLRYLGSERYGAWMAIVSVLGWLSVADLGIASHLTNALSSARGRGDEVAAREAISTSFFVLGGVGCGVFVVGAAVTWVIPWEHVFNVRANGAGSELRDAMLVAIALFCAGLPLTAVDRAYVALERGAEGNAWTAVGSVASVCAILGVVRVEGELPMLVGATMGTTLVVKAVSAAWLFARQHPELRPALACVTRSGTRSFLGRGSEFFLVQVAALVLFSTDNLVIAAVLGAREVVPYSVTWTLFGLSNALLALAFPYLWSAYSEAIARGDAQWIVRTFKQSMVGATFLAAAILAVLGAYGRQFIQVWAGPAAVPDVATVGWMVAWNLVLAPASCISCLLNAAGRTRVQAVAGLIAAPANIIASVFLARRYGGAGVIAATVLTYLGLAVLPTALAALREVRRFRAGLTGKVEA